MYNVTSAYRQRLMSGAMQHIRGTFRDISGTDHELTEIVGSPAYSRQAVEDPERFGLGEMYVGSMELRLDTSESESVFAGGEVSLEFGVSLDDSDEPEIEWIPLGVWDISAERESSRTVVLHGTDRIARLKVPTGRDEIGAINIATAMRNVTEVTGVEFAQTPEQVVQMIDRSVVSTFGVEFAVTCWEEVRMIAQLIGGFACADRLGRIEFRRFGGESVTITGDQRHSITLGERQCVIAGVSYTDKNGNTDTVTDYPASESECRITPVITGNRYILSTQDWYPGFYRSWLEPIAEYYSPKYPARHWYPGTVEYRGDPALDLGDIVMLTGGIKKTGYANFLICAENWQFRGVHTLISAGAPDSASGSTSGGSSGGGVSALTQINVTKSIRTVEPEKYPGSLYGAERTIARGGFSCRSETFCFLSAGLVFVPEEDSEGGVTLYLDGIAQDFRPRVTLKAYEPQTVFFTVPAKVQGGTHTLEVKAFGSAETGDITAYVYGQEITEESPELTGEEDFTYTISSGKATVTGYLGSSDSPEIPSRLGGGITTIIGKTAFTNSGIRAVWIPEGVEEIQ